MSLLLPLHTRLSLARYIQINFKQMSLEFNCYGTWGHKFSIESRKVMAVICQKFQFWKLKNKSKGCVECSIFLKKNKRKWAQWVKKRILSRVEVLRMEIKILNEKYIQSRLLGKIWQKKQMMNSGEDWVLVKGRNFWR